MKYALINGIILNGKEDMSPITGKAIIVENGKIVAIEDKAPAKIKTIDLAGKYILPGLINLHVHIPGNGMPSTSGHQNKKAVDFIMSNSLTRWIVFKVLSGFAKQQVLSGTTTIRAVGGLGNIDSRIRDAVNSGKQIGPRILAANMAVSVPNGHMAGVLAYVAHNEEEARMYVNKIAETKPNLIKIMITGGVLDAKVKGEPGELRMSPEIVKACCDEAHKLGYMVAAHVESPTGVKVALENGVDTIEHGAKPDEEIIKLFKERNAKDICTISPAVPFTYLDQKITGLTDLGKFNGDIVFEGIVNCAKTCLENDIPVGLGTDSACPFVTQYDMWREVYYFHKYVGVSNSFALHTATEINAKIVKIDDITGTIEVGKSADMLVVEKNPLDDLKNLRTPKLVIAQGRIIKNPKPKKYQVVEENLDKVL